MKRVLVVLFILLIFINFSSCEKDDICVDGDTPFLVIGFFDVDDSTSFKSVPSFRIKSIDNGNIFFSGTFSDRSTVADSVLIPLRNTNTDTTFEFIINSAGDEETGTIDTLSFSYSIEKQFVSRGCGFVANYNDLDVLRTVTPQDWIRRITIVEKNIRNNPTAIHVKIFH